MYMNRGAWVSKTANWKCVDNSRRYTSNQASTLVAFNNIAAFFKGCYYRYLPYSSHRRASWHPINVMFWLLRAYTSSTIPCTLHGTFSREADSLLLYSTALFLQYFVLRWANCRQFYWLIPCASSISTSPLLVEFCTTVSLDSRIPTKTGRWRNTEKWYCELHYTETLYTHAEKEHTARFKPRHWSRSLHTFWDFSLLLSFQKFKPLKPIAQVISWSGRFFKVSGEI